MVQYIDQHHHLPSSLALKFNSLRTAFLCLSFSELGSDPKPPVMGTGKAISDLSFLNPQPNNLLNLGVWGMTESGTIDGVQHVCEACLLLERIFLGTTSIFHKHRRRSNQHTRHTTPSHHHSKRGYWKGKGCLQSYHATKRYFRHLCNSGTLICVTNECVLRSRRQYYQSRWRPEDCSIRCCRCCCCCYSTKLFSPVSGNNCKETAAAQRAL